MFSPLGPVGVLRVHMAVDEEMKENEEDAEKATKEPHIGPFVYKNPRHSHNFLEGLGRIRDTSEFADITLCVGDMQFKCHKLVLSLASPYFQSMFNSGMKESAATEVTMREIDPVIFSKIIDYIYKGEILIEESNFQPLLEAGNMLQLETLCDGCAKYLEKELASTNCLGFWLFGQRLNNESLTKTALAYAREHFDQVQLEDEFFSLSAHDLCQYIGDDTLNVKSEDEVGQGVMSWLQRDPTTRLSSMKNILLHLRLNHLSMEYLRIHMMRSDALKQSTDCIQLVDRAMDMQLFPEEQLFELHSTFPRFSMGVEQCLLVLGRRLPKNMSHRDPTSVMRYHYYDDDLYRTQYRHLEGRPVHAVPLQRLPSEAYINGSVVHWVTNERIAACAVRNELFLAGLGTRCNEIWRYDGHRGDWQKCASLLKLCAPSYAVGVGEKIYIFGGIQIKDNKTTRIPLPTFEEYCMRTNRCRVAGELPKAVKDMACTVYEGVIYVLGGTDCSLSPTSCIQLVNIQKNPITVDQGPDLPLAPKRLGVARYKDTLLVATEKALLCYCLSSRVWRSVPSLGLGDASFGCCLVNHYLYVVGGPRSTDNNADDTDPEKKEGSAKKDKEKKLRAAVYDFVDEDEYDEEYEDDYDIPFGGSDADSDDYCGASLSRRAAIRGLLHSHTKEDDKPDETLVFRIKLETLLSMAHTEKQRDLVWEKFATLPREISVDSVCSVARPENKKSDSKELEKKAYVLA